MTGVLVIACFRPKPGMDERLLELVKRHVPTLRKERLAGDAPVIAGRAPDGTIVEIFTWASQAAIDSAHETAAVGALWAEFADACDYVSIADVAGASQLFSPFEPIDLT